MVAVAVLTCQDVCVCGWASRHVPWIQDDVADTMKHHTERITESFAAGRVPIDGRHRPVVEEVRLLIPTLLCADTDDWYCVIRRMLCLATDRTCDWRHGER